MQKKYVKLFGPLVMLLFLVLSACTTPPNLPSVKQNAAPETFLHVNIGAKIYINSGSFGPAIVHIKRGQAVEWIWQNYLETDQVVIKNVASSPIQDSGTWVYVFNKAGTYYFYSPFHYDMSGNVIVSG
jgi:plastocyanin